MFLTLTFNKILESERMPEEWLLVQIFKIKRDMGLLGSWGYYRGVKLMVQTMKLWERVVETRLRTEVTICEQQDGFMLKKSGTDAIFDFKMLIEKYREG